MSDVPHLNQLFRTGKSIPILIEDGDSEPVEVQVWMRPPSHEQQEQAMAKARAKQTRRKLILKDREGDEFLALAGEVDDLKKDQLINELFQFQASTARQEAYNTILHQERTDKDGKPTTWSGDYLDLILAQSSRLEEIERHNQASDEKILPEEDEEYQRINNQIEQFNDQIDTEMKGIEDREKAHMERMTLDDLREKFIQELVNTDIGLTWYQEYKLWMLFYSCRHPDNKGKLYFSSIEDLWDLPDWVRNKLFNEWEAMENPIANIKNSLAPLRSLLS